MSTPGPPHYPPRPPEHPPVGEPPGAPVPWWQHQWAVAAAALVALLAGGGLGYAIGASGKGSAQTQTVAREGGAQTVTHTVTHSAPSHTRVVIRTHTVTVTNPAPRSATPGGGGANYAGSGTSNVGTISVPRESTLRWTCEGECARFSIVNSPRDENSIGLKSGGRSGTTHIAAGTYREVRVVSSGTWSFAIE